MISHIKVISYITIDQKIIQNVRANFNITILGDLNLNIVTFVRFVVFVLLIWRIAVFFEHQLLVEAVGYEPDVNVGA